MKTFIFAFIALLLVSPLVVAGVYESCEIYGNCRPIASTISINNNTLNVNNSQFWQGYTPSGFISSVLDGLYYPLSSNPANYLTSAVADTIYCELTGCTLTGNLNMSMKNITGVDVTRTDIIMSNVEDTVHAPTGFWIDEEESLFFSCNPFPDCKISLTTQDQLFSINANPSYPGDPVNTVKVRFANFDVPEGNVSANYFVGDGSLLTNLPTPSFANVAFTNQTNAFTANQTFQQPVKGTPVFYSFGSATGGAADFFATINSQLTTTLRSPIIAPCDGSIVSLSYYANIATSGAPCAWDVCATVNGTITSACSTQLDCQTGQPANNYVPGSILPRGVYNFTRGQYLSVQFDELVGAGTINSQGGQFGVVYNCAI